MKIVFVFAAVMLANASISNAQCRPKDCVFPVNPSCKSYCQLRTLKISDENELKKDGYSENQIDKILMYRRNNDNYRFHSRDAIEREFKNISRYQIDLERPATAPPFQDVQKIEKPVEQGGQ